VDRTAACEAFVSERSIDSAKGMSKITPIQPPMFPFHSVSDVPGCSASSGVDDSPKPPVEQPASGPEGERARSEGP
jgi:hypothetical protein